MVRFVDNVAPADATKMSQWMGCGAGQFQGLLVVQRSRGTFMAEITGLIYPAARVRVPFGALESMPERTDDEFVALMAYQRQRWSPRPAQIDRPAQVGTVVLMRKAPWMGSGA